MLLAFGEVRECFVQILCLPRGLTYRATSQRMLAHYDFYLA